ncbi:MAG: flagellar export chaperone FliS [Phycisphaerae bacterium]|jgi:flagellar protein FliS
MSRLSTYQENQVLSQSPGRLVVMLYDGAIKFLNQAIDALDRQDFAEKGRLINKALDIIEELVATLNMEEGGEIAQNLRSLYLFMSEQLLSANFHKDPNRIREVTALLADLNGAWKSITS